MSSYNYDASISSIEQFDSIKSLLNKIETDANQNASLVKTDIEQTKAKVQSLMQTYGDISSAKGSLDDVNKDLSEIEKSYTADPTNKAVFKSPDFKKSILEKISFLQIEAAKKEAFKFANDSEKNKLFYNLVCDFLNKDDLNSAKALMGSMKASPEKDKLEKMISYKEACNKGDYENAIELYFKMQEGEHSQEPPSSKKDVLVISKIQRTLHDFAYGKDLIIDDHMRSMILNKLLIELKGAKEAFQITDNRSYHLRMIDLVIGLPKDQKNAELLKLLEENRKSPKGVDIQTQSTIIAFLEGPLNPRGVLELKFFTQNKLPNEMIKATFEFCKKNLHSKDVSEILENLFSSAIKSDKFDSDLALRLIQAMPEDKRANYYIQLLNEAALPETVLSKIKKDVNASDLLKNNEQLKMAIKNQVS